jgi:hypothetical protein
VKVPLFSTEGVRKALGRMASHIAKRRSTFVWWRKLGFC